jgi:hypothetical protein
VLGQHVVGSKGILDQSSMPVAKSSGRVVSSKTVNWYDLTLKEEKSRTSDQSAAEVAGMSSSLEGKATATADLMESEIDPGRDTSLTKRECKLFSLVGISVVPMCSRPTNGHTNYPDQRYYLKLSLT